MFAKLKKKSLKAALRFRAMVPVLTLSLMFLTITANAQTVSSNAQTSETEKNVPETQTTEAAQTPVLMPVWKNYKEVVIGMTADEVKNKLGKAEIADKDGFYYEFSNGETAQIVLDADKKVRVISISYKVKEGNAPKFEDILGADPTVEANSGGALYRLVRYPEAGYWVAYNRTAGDDGMITVTIQKL